MALTRRETEISLHSCWEEDWQVGEVVAKTSWGEDVWAAPGRWDGASGERPGKCNPGLHDAKVLTLDQQFSDLSSCQKQSTLSFWLSSSSVGPRICISNNFLNCWDLAAGYVPIFPVSHPLNGFGFLSWRSVLPLRQVISLRDDDDDDDDDDKCNQSTCAYYVLGMH